jgi:hypothetical protein
MTLMSRLRVRQCTTLSPADQQEFLATHGSFELIERAGHLEGDGLRFLEGKFLNIIIKDCYLLVQKVLLQPGRAEEAHEICIVDPGAPRLPTASAVSDDSGPMSP